jgi:hypothetical protein
MDRDLLSLLEQRADQDNPDYAWQAEVNNIAIRLKAATPETLQTEDEAWQAAKELRDSIAGLGYVLYGANRIGVVSEADYKGEPGKPGGWPIIGWRGTVDLLFGTQRPDS